MLNKNIMPPGIIEPVIENLNKKNIAKQRLIPAIYKYADFGSFFPNWHARSINIPENMPNKIDIKLPAFTYPITPPIIKIRA